MPVVAQPRDRETGTFALAVSGWMNFDDDDDVVTGDFVFVFELIPDFFRCEWFASSFDASQVISGVALALIVNLCMPVRFCMRLPMVF